MCAKDTGEILFAIKGYPCELTAMVIQKSGCEADAASGRDVDERSVVIGTVEAVDMPGGHQSVLHGPKGRRRTAANH